MISQLGTGTPLSIGQNSVGSASRNVLNEDLFETHTNLTSINKTGAVNISGPGGIFHARSDGNLNGGSINAFDQGVFQLVLGKTLTAGSGALIDLGGSGSASLSYGTTWNIQYGSELRAFGDLQVGALSGLATLVVDGIGSKLNTGSAYSLWDGNGHTADILLKNSATASVGGISLGSSSTPGTIGLQMIFTGGGTTTVFGDGKSKGVPNCEYLI